MDLFKIDNLNFTYPGNDGHTLNAIDFSVKQGDFVVLFGASGSGKTTLLKMLKPELTPHGEKSGTVLYKGEALETLDRRITAREIGYVMQNPETQIVTAKVWHELAFGLENLGENPSVIRRKVGEIANYFGIHTWFRQKTAELSGGQKQLLNLASVLVMEPDVLILDEPTSQLDPIAATNFIHTLEKVNRDFGLTVIMAEHRLEDVMALADQVILLEQGTVLLTGSPEGIGEQLKQLDEHHPMIHALPTAAKVFYGLNFRGDSPLTVREGKQFLTENYNPSVQPEKKEKTKAEPGNVVIELKDVWFRYERDLPDVVRGANLTVHEGEVVSVLGGNGSGKTTLLNLMAGQLRAYRGQVLINGKKIQKYSGKELYRGNIAVLPQDPQALFLKDTVREDYNEIAKAVGFSKEQLEKRMDVIADQLDIHHLLEQNPFDLSGGEQQKAALGKVLLLEPKILLLDEPTKGMDAFSKETLANVISLLRRQGLAIVIVTHDIEFAAVVSDRIGLYFDGELLAMEPPIEFFSKNHYYTTAASRMARHLFPQAITWQDIVRACEVKESIAYEKALD